MMQNRRPPSEAAGLAAVAAFRSDGRRLATTGPNGDLKLWDTTNPRQPALLLRLTDRYRFTAAAWNPAAADLLATLSTDASISIWRMLDDGPPREVRNLRLPYGGSGLLVWLADGRHIACACCDGTITMWNILSGSGHTEVLSDSAACLSISCGTDDVLRAAYADGSVRRMAPLARPGLLRARRVPPIAAACWSTTGHQLVISGSGKIEARDDALSMRWSSNLVAGRTLILEWHGDSEIVVADRTARRLIVLDTHGRKIWDTKLATAPTSLSAANGVVAVGGCNFRPQIIEVCSGTPLCGPRPHG